MISKAGQDEDYSRRMFSKKKTFKSIKPFSIQNWDDAEVETLEYVCTADLIVDVIVQVS